MKVTTRLVTILLVSLCLAAAPVFAQETAAKVWYLDFGAGINWLDQESGHPQPADAGFRLSFTAGRQLDARWSLELETGFLSNALPPARDREGHTISQVPLLLNLVHTFPTRSSLRPFLGAGFGAVIASGNNDTGGDVGLQLIAGARHVLDEGKSIGLSYRFLMFGVISALFAEPVGDDTLLLDLKLAI